MALVKCPECQTEISDTVKKCPHCGFVMKKKKSLVPIFISFIFLIVVLAFTSLWLYKTGTFDKRSNEVVTKKNIIAPIVNDIVFNENLTLDQFLKILNEKNISYESQEKDTVTTFTLKTNDWYKNNNMLFDTCYVRFEDKSRLWEIELLSSGKRNSFMDVVNSFRNFDLIDSGKTEEDIIILGKHQSQSFRDEHTHYIDITYWEFVDTLYVVYRFHEKKD